MILNVLSKNYTDNYLYTTEKLTDIQNSQLTMSLLCPNCYSRFYILIQGTDLGLYRNDLVKSMNSQIHNLFQYYSLDTV